MRSQQARMPRRTNPLPEGGDRGLSGAKHGRSGRSHDAAAPCAGSEVRDATRMALGLFSFVNLAATTFDLGLP